MWQTYQSDNTSGAWNLNASVPPRRSLPEIRAILGLDPNPYDVYTLERWRDLYAASMHLALPLYLRDLEGWVRKVWDTAGR